MARDPKWAVNEALEKGEIHKISVSEEQEKTLLSSMRKSSVGMFFASLAVLVIALAIVFALVTFVGIIFYSVKMVIVYIMILLFPIYAVYNIISTANSIKKKDYDFYEGELVTKTDNGYKIKGLEDREITFMQKSSRVETLKPGDTVKFIRLKDELSLFDFD